MARNAATLVVQIISDGSRASQGFADASTRADRFQAGLDRASVAAGGVVTAIAGLGVAAFNSASELQQQAGAVESVFKAQAGAVDQLAKTAADRVGLATSSYSQLSAVLGSQLGNAGYSGQQLVGTTDQLITAGADLAATFGGTTSEAVEALSSLMRGERDPIERYGVSISQAAIDARVAADGLDVSTEAAKRQAGVQATLAILTDQTAAAQGAFARESETAAGQQQRAAAAFENAKAALGEALLPVVTAAAQEFAGLATWVGENTGTVGVFIGVVGALALGILAVNAALRAYRAAQVVATAAQWLFNAAAAANPLGLIVLAIAAVVAGLVLAYNRFEGFRNFVQSVARAVMNFLSPIGDLLGTIGRGIGRAASFVGNLFGAPEAPAARVASRSGGSGTAASGLYGAALAPTTSGALFAAGNAQAAAQLAGMAAGAGGTTVVVQGDTVTINVTGAVVDRAGTADAIAKLLADRDRDKGRRVAVALS